jgi:hypothetical protein
VGDTKTYTHRQAGDLISLLSLLESRLKIRIIFVSSIFLKKIGSRTHIVTQNSPRKGEVLVISMTGRKRCGLHPSEKELLERSSRIFRHKISLFFVHFDMFSPNMSQATDYNQYACNQSSPLLKLATATQFVSVRNPVLLT